MINVNPGFPMPTEAQVAAAAPGTLFVPLLDFSPVEGQDWRGPRILRAKVYVNAPDGADWTWADGGFYQIVKVGPAKWLLSATDDSAMDPIPVGPVSTFKTRQAAAAAAAVSLRERQEAVSA